MHKASLCQNCETSCTQHTCIPPCIHEYFQHNCNGGRKPIFILPIIITDKVQSLDMANLDLCSKDTGMEHLAPWGSHQNTHSQPGSVWHKSQASPGGSHYGTIQTSQCYSTLWYYHRGGPQVRANHNHEHMMHPLCHLSWCSSLSSQRRETSETI